MRSSVRPGWSIFRCVADVRRWFDFEVHDHEAYFVDLHRDLADGAVIIPKIVGAESTTVAAGVKN
jgi:hypothetical protein